ncbi:MAG: 2-oxoacid:acceptor oxidoreductase subunit alpha [Candidatus Wolfebacteria bacterium]|nr:2-oxoacid:acceptor oxidoreductase subunit alpha [Candidatus Wolfebacteria bacterium]
MFWKKKNQSPNIFTVAVGGAAGDGVREAGTNLGRFLTKLGFEVFVSFDYPSLIRGGHNFSRISFSKEKIYNDYSKIDVLIALNDETMHLHKNELNGDAVVFSEKFDAEDLKMFGQNAMLLPMIKTTEELNAPAITRTSVALGAVCYLLDLPFGEIDQILRRVFKEKGYEINVTLAEKGYKHLENLGFRHSRRMEHNGDGGKELADGNTAFAKGLLAAGLDFYIAYPMTPSTSILHYLAKQSRFLKESGKKLFKVIHPENEIAVINMALGAVYAGKRTAIGTAGGGFALMQEAFALAGMSETPIAIAVSQRQAPATGSPTHTAQGDLKFIINSGHGEFPRIVIAPGDPEEAFKAGADALNLTWKYQVPAIVLLDKHLSENSSTSILDISKIAVEKGKVAKNISGGYKRYQITEDGVSEMAFPGTAGAVIKATSYEHTEEGISTEDPKLVKAMGDKRFSKLKQLEKEFSKYDTVKVYGDPKSKNVIVFWGSTKGAVLEAGKYLKKQPKFLQILWMSPFDSEKVTENLKDAKNIIIVENNRTGQLASVIREKTGINIENKILKYDSLPFEVIELAKQLNEIL